jgi:hypothetical protein
MILRRFMQHVNEQNWFAVWLDVLVVIFGVYIGIYLGEVAAERATRAEVHDALEVIRLQLEEDLKDADRIIAYRQEKLQQPERLQHVLADDDFDRESFGRDLSQAFSRLYTLFPKSSGYGTMRDRGYIAELDDLRLLEALAYLFDQVYVRHVVIADESDQNTFFFERNVIAVYWDIGEPGFVGDERVARARIRNSLFRLTAYSEWYVQFLSETLRPAITDALDAIEAYQARQGGAFAAQ